MYMPREDRSWALSLLTLCVVVWLIVGCAVTLPEPEAAGNPSAPEFDTIWMLKPYTCPGVDYGTFGGYIRQDSSAFAYGVMMNKKPVWFMIYEIGVQSKIGQAWVDPDFDGDYELYFPTGKELADVYPNPCDVIPSGPGAKL